jgi:hypothetical protein
VKPIRVVAVPAPKRSRLRQVSDAVARIERAEDRPSVVAVNPRGDQHVLFSVPEGFDTAVDKAERVERELDEIGLSAWAQRYGVSLDFLHT